MDARKKAEKMVELASKIAALDETKQAWLKELTDLVNGSAFPAEAAPKAAKRARKKYTNPKFPVPAGMTRDTQLYNWIKQHGPAPYAEILRAQIIPEGSIHYYLRKLIDAKLITFSNNMYAIVPVGVKS